MTERELWPAKRVAAEYGWHPGYARRWLSQNNIEHVTTTGPRDTRLYDPDKVRAAHDRMPGRGYRTDLHTPPATPAPTGAPMRREQLEQAVRELVEATFDTDVAEAITEDPHFGSLVGTLQRETSGDYDAMDRAITAVANGLEDRTLDWLVDGADKPAAFIASRI